MDHRDCVERLPWYLAGSLEPGERSEIEGHLEGCAECRAELAATRAAARLFAGEHPSPAELVAAAWEDPPTAAARAVELHADRCPECREELALARASRELEPVAAERGLAALAPVLALAPVAEPGARARSARSLQLVAAALVAALGLGLALAGQWQARRAAAEKEAVAGRLAAAEAEAAAGLAARGRAESAERRIVDLQARVERLLVPQAGLALVELLPLGVTRGAGAEPALTAVERPAGAYFALLLVLERPEAHRTYVARLRGPDGGELWSAPGASPDAAGTLALLVPTTLLPDGLLGVEVEGETPDGTRPVATYRLLVRAPARRGP